MVETIVYYSLQRVGSFGVVPSPINRRWEKEAAEKEASQTVAVTMGYADRGIGVRRRHHRPGDL